MKTQGENNMALKFGDAKGSAQKSSLVQYQYVDGDNSVRLVGDILPRYVYWVQGENNKNIPMAVSYTHLRAHET